MSLNLQEAMKLANQSDEGRAHSQKFFEIKRKNDELMASAEANPDLLVRFYKAQQHNEQSFITKMERVRGAKAPREIVFVMDDDLPILSSQIPSVAMVEVQSVAVTEVKSGSLAPATVTPEIIASQQLDGALKMAFQAKLTSDTPQTNTPINAVVKNCFPTPTTERSKHVLTLAFLADVASYWGHSLYVVSTASILHGMALAYLPSSSLEEGLKEVAEFIGIISGEATETRTALNKLKSFLDKLWNAPKPPDKKKSDTHSHISFRNSYWVKEAEDSTLKALGLKK